jgi:CRISPR/Cas system-associated exonuclease Cas4 (RecB family)
MFMQTQEIVSQAGSGIGAFLPLRRDDNPFKGNEAGFYLSKTRMARYTACPRSYRLAYQLNIKPIKTPVELLIGKSTHKLIAESFLARAANMIPDLTGSLDAFWTDEMKAPATRAEMENAKREAGRYACLFIKEVDLTPLAVEKEFSIPVVNYENGDILPVPLVGIIDLVDQPNGTPRALEIKTRSRKGDDLQPRVSLELTCYAYWIKSQLLSELNEDVNIDKIPVGYLNIIKTKTPSIQKQEGFRTIRDFIDLFETAKAVYENIMDGRFYRNPGTHCGWCEYAPVCAGKGRTELAQVFGEEACDRLWEADLI